MARGVERERNGKKSRSIVGFSGNTSDGIYIILFLCYIMQHKK